MKLSTFDDFKHIRSESLYYLTPDELSAMQKLLTGILFDTADVCERHGIRYYLGGGTALGAVRHHGFIPWDDDVDIMMPRRDFQRFCEVFPAELGETYWIHIPGSTRDYPILQGRIVKKGTLVRTRDDFRNEQCGAFIDVAVIENVPDAPILRALHGFGCLAFGLLTSCRKFYRDRKPLLRLAKGNAALCRKLRLKICLGFFTAFLPMDTWTRAAHGWNGLCKNENSRYISIPAGRRHYFGELYRREDICSSVPMSFEGRELSSVRAYDRYLTQLYGDYKTPEEGAGREAHAFLSKPVL